MNEVYIPKAILIDKESGKQFEVNMQSAFKPWPTEQAEEESALRTVYNKTFTVKISKKDSIAFKKLLRRHKKIHRKLKKAWQHIHYMNDLVMIEHRDERPFRYEFVGYQGFVKNNGYPRTKWIKKAIRMGNKIVTEAAMRIIEAEDTEESEIKHKGE